VSAIWRPLEEANRVDLAIQCSRSSALASRRSARMLSIGEAYPWWSHGIFLLCIYIVHGIIVRRG